MACDLPRYLDDDGNVVTWREGDTEPPITFTLAGGLQVSAFTITLHIRRPDGTLLVKTAADLGGSNGEFTWAAGDLQAGMNQRAEISSDDGAGAVFTWPPFLMDVDERVGL